MKGIIRVAKSQVWDSRFKPLCPQNFQLMMVTLLDFHAQVLGFLRRRVALG